LCPGEKQLPQNCQEETKKARAAIKPAQALLNAMFKYDQY
jgi:hypothetical protein